jgi:hypothetical protein
MGQLNPAKDRGNFLENSQDISRLAASPATMSAEAGFKDQDKVLANGKTPGSASTTQVES